MSETEQTGDVVRCIWIASIDERASKRFKFYDPGLSSILPKLKAVATAYY